MRINNLNGCNYGNNTTFGYKLPERVGNFVSWKTSDFIEMTARSIREKGGDTAYNDYIDALNELKNKKFDTYPIISQYRKEIKDDSTREDFRWFLNEDVRVPSYEGTEKKVITKEVLKFPSKLGKLFGQKPKIKKVTEIAKEDKYSWTINPQLCIHDQSAPMDAPEIAQYDYVALAARLRISDVDIERGGSFEKYLSSAEGIRTLTQKTDEALTNFLKRKLDYIVFEK